MGAVFKFRGFKPKFKPNPPHPHHYVEYTGEHENHKDLRKKEGIAREISPFGSKYLTPATFCLELFLNMFPFLIYVF